MPDAGIIIAIISTFIAAHAHYRIFRMDYDNAIRDVYRQKYRIAEELERGKLRYVTMMTNIAVQDLESFEQENQDTLRKLIEDDFPRAIKHIAPNIALLLSLGSGSSRKRKQ